MTSELKDFSLVSGERQTAHCLDDIRFDHRVRYQLALETMLVGKPDQRACLDIFCGNGYGTYMLGYSLPRLFVLGIDGSREAIDVANTYYSLPNTLYSYKKFPCTLPTESFDFLTCFESLEHVSDDASLLQQLARALRPGGQAMISVPNDDVHSLTKNPHAFHFRHYRHEEFMNSFSSLFLLKDWWGQNVYEFDESGVCLFKLLSMENMTPTSRSPGQVNIYWLERK